MVTLTAGRCSFARQRFFRTPMSRLLLPSLLVVFSAAFAAGGRQSSSPPQAQLPEGQGSRPSTEQRILPTLQRYTLTPEKRSKAIAYSRALYACTFAGVALSLGIYFLGWRGRVAAVFRNWARRVSPRHFVQCLVFVPLFLGGVSALQFPLEFYADFVLEHRFDLSTQGFVSWLGDWGKSFALFTLLGIFVVWVFFLIVRRSPRRWWLYFWLMSVPAILFLMLIEPYVVEPLFFRFTPLEKTRPALTERIHFMLRHAGVEIPSPRILEMDASTKTRTINAYVSGIGTSERVVVWDTTLGKLSEDETLLVIGHEAGHYALDHAIKEFCLIEVVALALSYLGFLAFERLVRRLGAATDLEGVGDLASLPVALIVLTVLGFFTAPIFCAISRHYEHQADQFGIELAYGIVPDPNGAEARSLEVLGEEDLADPSPNPLIKLWLYTHPPLDDRIRFALSYKPWAEGEPLKLVHPQEP